MTNNRLKASRRTATAPVAAPVTASAAPQTPLWRDRWRSPVALATAAALLVRAVVLVQLHGHPLLQPAGGLDTAAYIRLARQAAGGDWALGPEPYFVSPLYVYFLALFFRLFGDGLLLPRVVQVLLGTTAVYLIAATARRLFASELAAAVAAWLSALCGVVVFHEILLLQSSLDPFLTALALFALVRAATRDGGWPDFAAAGAAFGLLVANRPNALPAALAAALVLALVRRSRRSAVEALALVAGLSLVLAPFALRNRAVSGEWIAVSSHGGLNFYIGNNAEADGTYHAVPGITPAIEGQAKDAARLAAEALGHAAPASEVSSYFYGRAFSWIRAEPRAATRLFARKLGYLLNAVEVPLNYSYAYYARDGETLLRGLVVGSWLVVPLGLLGLVVRPPARDQRAWLAWAVFIPAYGLSVAAFFVSARYRLPLLVPLLLAAGAALAQGVDWARQRRWRPLALAALALGPLLYASLRNAGLDDGLGLERSEMVLQQLAAGRDAEADALLQKAVPLLANPGLLYYRMGLVFNERSQPAQAVDFFLRALQADPGQPDVQLSLGQALVASGRAAQAEPHLRAARDAGVDPAAAGYALARILLATGRRLEAQDELRRAAAALKPADGSALVLGMLALSLGAADVAEPALRNALQSQPDLGEAHQALGLALAQTGRLADARLELEAAVRIQPDSASARFNLAVVCLRAGHLDDARRYAREALALQPDHPQAAALLSQLSAPR